MRPALLSMLVVLAPVTAVAQPADEDLDVPAAPATGSGSGAAAPSATPSAPTPAVPTTPSASAPTTSSPPAPPAAAPTTPASAPTTPAPVATTTTPAAASVPSNVAASTELHAEALPPVTLGALFDASGIDLHGYVQAQGQTDQQSQDQLMQGGNELNRDGFVVRRARIALARRWEYAALAFELDANTVNGARVGARRAEAEVHWPAADRTAPPLIALAVGLTDIPFGRELVESSQQRLFMERSTASLAFFPGEPDIGARAFGAYRQFRYTLAVLSGEPINERSGLNRSDPNAAKDFLGRVGIEVSPLHSLVITAGASTLVGKGFHAGHDATKDTVEWRDLNQNGAIELGELTSIPGTAATPSQNFRRWAIGADLEVRARSRIGWTRFATEATVASNLDRGLFVADPITVGSDIRHLGVYAFVTQELGKIAFAGVRFDYYDPNLDAFDSRSGMLVPRNETITTLSPLVGARLPYHVRAAVQYDVILDNLARDAQGVPTDLANNRLTARLQVDL